MIGIGRQQKTQKRVFGYRSLRNWGPKTIYFRRFCMLYAWYAAGLHTGSSATSFAWWRQRPSRWPSLSMPTCLLCQVAPMCSCSPIRPIRSTQPRISPGSKALYHPQRVRAWRAEPGYQTNFGVIHSPKSANLLTFSVCI